MFHPLGTMNVPANSQRQAIHGATLLTWLEIHIGFGNVTLVSLQYNY